MTAVPRNHALNSSLSSSVATWLVALLLLIIAIMMGSASEFGQQFLTLPLVVCGLLLCFSYAFPLARPKDGKTDWFHPAILFCAFYVFYVVFPGSWIWLYHDYDSTFINVGVSARSTLNTVFLLGSLSILAYGLGSRACLATTTRARVGRYGPATLASLASGRRMKILLAVAIAYAGIGLVFKLYQLSKYGSLSAETLRYLSPSRRENLGIDVSLAIQMLGNLLDWGALLIFLLSLAVRVTSGTRVLLWIAVGALFFAATIDFVTSGKRSAVVFLSFLPVVWWHYLVKPFSLAKAVAGVVIFVVAILGMLVARIAVPLVVEGVTPTDYIGSDAIEAIPFFVDSGEFATFDMIELSITERSELLRETGGAAAGFMKYTFGTAHVFIPRLVWPTKPGYEDLSQKYRLVALGDSNGGIAPTVWGVWYMFFGPFGLGILMFMMGYFFELIYRKTDPSAGAVANVVLYSMFLWLAFQAMRFGTLGFVLLLVVQTMAAGFLSVWLLRTGKNGGRSSA